MHFFVGVLKKEKKKNKKMDGWMDGPIQSQSCNAVDLLRFSASHALMLFLQQTTSQTRMLCTTD